ncbi:MAG: ATP-binding protein [Bacteroidales bacterium]
MERLAIAYLKEWKNKARRKPLIVKGARQVGKTWLIKKFGETEYKQIAYVNFEISKTLKSLFLSDFNISRIIEAVQLETEIRINPENTLIVFDEIQEAEGGLTSLKYFCENAPEYHVIAAGSLLGIAMHSTKSFPVGKVDFLNLYPLNFEEFLLAMNQKPLLELLKKKDWELIKTFKDRYIGLLRKYYYVGGMPEAVASFVQNEDFDEVRHIQKQILVSYDQDFSKHAPSEIVPRLRMVWDSILTQLSRENKKFIYGVVKKGARAKDYEQAFAWLLDCGLAYKINRVSKPGMPLKAYADNSAFKLYMLDLGLLAAMGDLDAKTLLDGNNIFVEFKGALTEQYVLQQLGAKPNLPIYYWSAEKGTAELDFLVQYAGEIVPIEVKAEENLQAKSLKAYCHKYKPRTALRTSMSDYRNEDWLINMPLYTVGTSFKTAP